MTVCCVTYIVAFRVCKSLDNGLRNPKRRVTLSKLDQCIARQKCNVRCVNVCSLYFVSTYVERLPLKMYDIRDVVFLYSKEKRRKLRNWKSYTRRL